MNSTSFHVPFIKKVGYITTHGATVKLLRETNLRRMVVGFLLLLPATLATVVGTATTYRALVAGSVGKSFRDVARVVELPTPELADDEVLVKVMYAGVNGGCETFRSRGEVADRSALH